MEVAAVERLSEIPNTMFDCSKLVSDINTKTSPALLCSLLEFYTVVLCWAVMLLID